MAVIPGTLGNDPNISGTVGDDTLIGLNGNDFLNFGLLVGSRLGDDAMIGGSGNDTYFVNTVGDRVFEELGGGIDTIQSTISFSLNAALPQHSVQGTVENLTLLGVANLNGTGNALANTINGNGGNNILSGLAGNDVLNGNAGNDILNGGLNNDVLNGGLNQDDLFGGAGFDTFVFAQGHSPSINGQADVIGGWSAPFDQIDMPVDAVAGNYVEHNGTALGIDTIAEAAAHAGAFHNNRTYVFLWNVPNNTGFLVADLDNNNVFETGVVLLGAGNAAAMSHFDIF